jgi:hypothetical protein
MNRKHWLGALGVAVMGAGALGAPAQASQSFTIYGSSAPAVNGAAAFLLSGCKSEVQKAIQGIDTVIIDVSGQVNTDVSITWSGVTAVKDAWGVGALSPTFFSAGCSQVANNVRGSSTPGTWAFRVPSNAKWLAVTSSYLFNVSLTTSW